MRKISVVSVFYLNYLIGKESTVCIFLMIRGSLLVIAGMILLRILDEILMDEILMDEIYS